LDLSARQRLAITQELQYQQLGLPAYSDPTPWQRLTRAQQIEFNRKYLALPLKLQEYSRNQFLSLPEARQERAYMTFLTVDIETLSQAIAREYERERRVLDRQSQEYKDSYHQHIQNRLRQKKLEYSAMQMDNNVMMNDISVSEEVKEVEEVEITTSQNFITILKQQLSNSLQLSPTGEEEAGTTQLPPTLKEEPRSQGGQRTLRLDTPPVGDHVKASARVPKSNSSILTARASLVRKFHSKSPPSISEQEKRINIQRLMYDPRRKLVSRSREK